MTLLAKTLRSWCAFGYNADIDQAQELIADNGTTIANYKIGTAAAVTIVSADAKDAAAGVGARTVRIHGLDSNWDYFTADASLNGVSAVTVTTPATAFRVFLVEVLTAGSEGDNAGALTTKISTTVVNIVAAGNNRSLGAVFTIPRGHVGHLRKIFAQETRDVAFFATVKLWTQKSKDSEAYQMRFLGTINGDSNESWLKHTFDEPLLLEEGTDVYLTAIGSADNNFVVGGFDVALVF